MFLFYHCVISFPSWASYSIISEQKMYKNRLPFCHFFKYFFPGTVKEVGGNPNIFYSVKSSNATLRGIQIPSSGPAEMKSQKQIYCTLSGFKVTFRGICSKGEGPYF
jgi:hypothetical protein